MDYPLVVHQCIVDLLVTYYHTHVMLCCLAILLWEHLWTESIRTGYVDDFVKLSTHRIVSA